VRGKPRSVFLCSSMCLFCVRVFVRNLVRRGEVFATAVGVLEGRAKVSRPPGWNRSTEKVAHRCTSCESRRWHLHGCVGLHSGSLSSQRDTLSGRALGQPQWHTGLLRSRIAPQRTQATNVSMSAILVIRAVTPLDRCSAQLLRPVRLVKPWHSEPWRR